jgi:hypothetical protein
MQKQAVDGVPASPPTVAVADQVAAAALANQAKGPLLPRLLERLGKLTQKGIWHVSPGLVPGMPAKQLGAIVAGLTAGTLLSPGAPQQPSSYELLKSRGMLPPEGL